MAKLQGSAQRTILVSMPDEGTLNSPHIVYANLNFEAPNTDDVLRDFFKWLKALGLTWDDAMIRRYLQANQPNFRACLKLLIELAQGGFQDDEILVENVTMTGIGSVRRFKRTELDFLQAHGLRHSLISLRPMPVRKSNLGLCGVELHQEGPHDAIDPFAWHLIQLMQKGSLRIRLCKFAKCQLFFEPKTPRKFYCSDLCRSKDHMKTREEMRVYMQGYRKLKKDGVVRNRSR